MIKVDTLGLLSYLLMVCLLCDVERCIGWYVMEYLYWLGFDVDLALSYRKGAHNEGDPAETRLRTSCHNFIVLGWRGSVGCRFTTEVPTALKRSVVKLTDG
jgi:hypothetical protein